MSSKAWAAKSIDVNPDQWQRVKVASAAEGIEVRQWIDRVIYRALEQLDRRRQPNTIRLGAIKLRGK
jgi:hypothetical protein